MLAYPVGSIVRINGKEDIIVEANLSCGVLEYATINSAWHNHDEVELVNLPTKESLNKAIASFNDEEF